MFQDLKQVSRLNSTPMVADPICSLNRPFFPKRLAAVQMRYSCTQVVHFVERSMLGWLFKFLAPSCATIVTTPSAAMMLICVAVSLLSLKLHIRPQTQRSNLSIYIHI